MKCSSYSEAPGPIRMNMFGLQMSQSLVWHPMPIVMGFCNAESAEWNLLLHWALYHRAVHWSECVIWHHGYNSIVWSLYIWFDYFIEAHKFRGDSVRCSRWRGCSKLTPISPVLFVWPYHVGSRLSSLPALRRVNYKPHDALVSWQPGTRIVSCSWERRPLP